MAPSDQGSQTPPPLDRVAGILYATILGFPMLFLAVVFALRTTMPPAIPDLPVLVYVGLAVGAATFGMAMWLRSRLEPAGSDRGAWWQANMRAVIVIWAVLEAGGMAQAVFYMLTGNAYLLGGVAMFFLFPMSLTTPSHLSGS